MEYVGRSRWKYKVCSTVYYVGIPLNNFLLTYDVNLKKKIFKYRCAWRAVVMNYYVAETKKSSTEKKKKKQDKINYYAEE